MYLIFILLPAAAYAHLPVFPPSNVDVYHVDKALTHSYAVYATLKRGSFGVSFYCKPGKIAALSLSQPQNQIDSFTVTMSEAVACDTQFDGWNTGSKEYLAPSTTPREVNGTAFEPFGVMVYEKRASCMFECQNENLFTFEVSGPDRSIAVGVGTEEVFDELDIVLSMRLNIYRIFHWADVPIWVYVIAPLSLFVACTIGVERAFGSEKEKYLKVTAHFISAVLLSALYFGIVMLYLGETSSTSVVVHLLLPALVCLPQYYLVFKMENAMKCLIVLSFFILFVYSLIMVWGDVFFFAPLYCAASLFYFTRSRTYRGTAYKLRQMVPANNEVMVIA